MSTLILQSSFVGGLLDEVDACHGGDGGELGDVVHGLHGGLLHKLGCQNLPRKSSVAGSCQLTPSHLTMAFAKGNLLGDEEEESS